MTAARGRVAFVVLVALALGGCTKPDWLGELEGVVDRAVPRLEAALDQLAAELPAAVARLDEISRQRLLELDGTLRDAVEGLDHALARRGEQLDAALAARVGQLASIAASLAADVHGIALGVTSRTSTTVSQLLGSTRAAAAQLLGELGAQIGAAEQAGALVISEVRSEGRDLVVRIAGLALIVLGLAGGALAFVVQWRRRRAVAFWIQLALVVAATAAGSLLVLWSGLRARLAGAAPVVVDHRSCPDALAGAASYLGRHRGAPTPEAAVEATEVLPAVASCLVLGGSSELFERATQRLAELRAWLGIARACVAPADCPAGEQCEVGSGACVAACETHRDCPAGQVCHGSERACGPPCTGACPGTARCTASVCTAGSAAEIPGRRGWTRAAACRGDPVCLSLARPSLARVLRGGR